MVKVVVPIQTVSERVSKNAVKINRIRKKPVRVTREKKSYEESWYVRYFKEFASNTALHGYNHIVRENSTKWER